MHFEDHYDRDCSVPYEFVSCDDAGSERGVPEAYREEIQREAVRAWVASLRADREALYDPSRLRKLTPVPKAIRATLADGVASGRRLPDPIRNIRSAWQNVSPPGDGDLLHARKSRTDPVFKTLR